ncbi:MAG: hypothetical protein OJF50_003379 [Nitrospira sp.]|nr:hypothetical protein [Nitrospira sp.]
MKRLFLEPRRTGPQAVETAGPFISSHRMATLADLVEEPDRPACCRPAIAELPPRGETKTIKCPPHATH